MAEFRHYTTFDEAMAILRDIVETRRVKVIPEEPMLVEPKLDSFDRFQPELAERLSKFGVLHLEGPFTRYAMQFKRREGGGAAGTFYIDDSIGPRLHWTLPGTKLGNLPEIGPGSLSYYKSYRDPISGRRELPSEQLKEAFKEIVDTMKKHMVQVTAHGRRIWVGRDTKHRWDAGQLMIDV